MVVELRSLRITSDFDASRYVAGMDAKVAADKRGADSSKAAGAAIEDQKIKVSSAVPLIEKLSRTYVDGYGTAQKFNQAMLQLASSQKQNASSVEHLESVYKGIQSRFGLQADAIELQARGYNDLAKAIENVNGRLATQRSLQDRPAARPDTLPGANDNNSRFRQQNLGYQLFDIAGGVSSGQSLRMIAAQQGPQLVQLYAGNGGVNAAFKDLTSVLGGVARAAGPVIIAGGALYGAYKLITANSAEAKLQIDASTAALAAQAAPIAQVQGQLKELQELQLQYAAALNTSARTHTLTSETIVAATQKEYEAKRALLELELKRQEAARAAVQSELEITSLRLKNAIAQQVTTNMDLERQGFADPRVGRFTQLPDSITGIEKTQDLLAKNPLNDKIKELTANLTLSDIALGKLREGLGLVGPSASGQIGQIDQLTKALEELRKIGGAALSPIEEASTRAMAAVPVVNGILDEEARRRVLASQRAAQRRLDDQNPTIVDGDGVRVRVPVPTQRPNIELEGLPGEGKEQKSAAEAYRDLVKSAGDRIGQMKLEVQTSGLTGIAAQRLRFELDLVQSAQDKGRTVTEAQRGEIHKLGEEYEQAARQAASLKLQSDAQFDRQQLGRSDGEQQIASQLRGAGLPVDLGSYEAGILRANAALRDQVKAWEDVRNIGRDAIDQITGSALSGFSDIKSVLAGVAQDTLKTINQLAIANPLKNALYGDQLPTLDTVGGMGGIFGALLGGRSPASMANLSGMNISAATVTINFDEGNAQ